MNNIKENAANGTIGRASGCRHVAAIARRTKICLHRGTAVYLSKVLPLCLAAALLSACGTARVNQFDAFATAGVKFADAVPPVLDAAFEKSVEVDSLVLTKTRENLSQDDRFSSLEESDKNLKARLDIFDSLKAHASILRAYFIALKALAASDAPSGLTASTKGLVSSLGKLDSKISSLSVGKLPLSDFLGQAVPLAVAQFQSAALNQELKERAGAIERELDLQQAALSAIAATMKSELETQFAAEDAEQIVRPFVTNGQLPRDWSTRRLEAFRRRIQFALVDSAVSAARNLRLSFMALVENRIDEGAITLLIDDVNKVAALLAAIKGKKAEG